MGRSVGDRQSGYRSWVGIPMLLGLWLLFRPYRGVTQDARIYVGTALAQLDPAGIGQDLMFILDEQSKYSLFQPVITTATDVLGLEAAGFILTLVGMIAWLAGAWLLVSQLAGGRTRWAALILVIILPPRFAVIELFEYAQGFITPRLFAEAATLTGLGFFLRNRFWLSGILLAASVGIHPLMGVPAAAIAGVILAIRDRRWLAVAGAGLAALLAIAAAGLPVAERLFTTMDPEWIGQIRIRNAYLFPTEWEPQSYLQLGVHAATVLLAALVSSGKAREVLRATLIVGVGGFVASLVLVDWLSNLLVAQLQIWRGLWILAVLANAGLAIVAVRLWPAGPSGRLVLAGLAATWVTLDVPVLTAPLLVTTLLLYVLFRRASRAPGPGLVRAAWALVVIGGLVVVGARVSLVGEYLAGAAEVGGAVSLEVIMRTLVRHVPLAVLPLAWAIGSRSTAAGGRLALFVSVAVLVAGAILWDDRSPYQTYIERAVVHQPVASIIESDDPGAPIIWVDGTIEAWTLAGRPNWSIPVQAAGGVFSRELALEAEGRIATLIDLGLASPDARDTFQTSVKEAPEPEPGSIEAACALQPPPAAVVVPSGMVGGITSRTWVSPVPHFTLRPGDPWVWERVDRFEILNCR